MKVVYTALIACLLIAGCSKSKAPSPTTANEDNSSLAARIGGGDTERGIVIPLHNCYNTVTGTDSIRICFDSVLVDCRCPRKVVCVWAGYASVALTITVNGTTQYAELSTLGPNSVIISGYEFTFVDLLPYPVYGVTPAPGDIKVVMTVTKV